MGHVGQKIKNRPEFIAFLQKAAFFQKATFSKSDLFKGAGLAGFFYTFLFLGPHAPHRPHKCF